MQFFSTEIQMTYCELQLTYNMQQRNQESQMHFLMKSIGTKELFKVSMLNTFHAKCKAFERL